MKYANFETAASFRIRHVGDFWRENFASNRRSPFLSFETAIAEALGKKLLSIGVKWNQLSLTIFFYRTTIDYSGIQDSVKKRHF